MQTEQGILPIAGNTLSIGYAIPAVITTTFVKLTNATHAYVVAGIEFVVSESVMEEGALIRSNKFLTRRFSMQKQYSTHVSDIGKRNTKSTEVKQASKAAQPS